MDSDIIYSIFAMSTKEKLIERFKSLPSDFTFDELVRLFTAFGFELSNKGATSGSRVVFKNQKKKKKITLHKPHPGNTINTVAMKSIYAYLKGIKLL